MSRKSNRDLRAERNHLRETLTKLRAELETLRDALGALHLLNTMATKIARAEIRRGPDRDRGDILPG